MTAASSGHIPLTTTFTPPSSCLNDLWLVGKSGSGWMNLGPTSTSECLPSGWATSSYFSPGICPSGYVIASSGVVYAGTVTESAATCCPVVDGRTYSPRDTYTAWSEVCQWRPESTATTEYNYTWVDSDGYTSSTTGSMSSNGHVNAYGVSIRWQSTDFSTPPATAAISTIAFVDATSTSESSSLSPTNSDPPSSRSGLSSGAKVGIGVGVAVGAILVIALVLALLFIRRLKRHPQYQGNTPGLVYKTPNELPTKPTLELPTRANPQSSDMVELDGQR
ncbi:hypothetical protein MW887_004283 [Aspergillus wentii]|nr:hypothetical protein MW887_004283 [Aspergillus wentii]